MTHMLRGKTAVVGVGLAGCGEAPGRSSMELLAEASYRACSDAGISIGDVDGVFAGTPNHVMAGLSVSEYLGLQPKYSNGSMIGGASYIAHTLNAAMALHCGLCDVALICYGSNQRTAGGKLISISEPPPYEMMYGPRMPTSAYALAASRHMHQYGTTKTHLAHVAVAANQWAQLNPEAFAREPITIDDVLSARMISDPLGKLDCCLVTDGAGAVVMTRADRAKDMPHTPVYLLGSALAHFHRQITMMPDLTITAASDSGPRALEMAGMKPADMDMLQLYDAFTINTILFLEDLGYCAKGEGGPYVSDGKIAPGGSLPVNTNGGGLSCVHPGMYSIFLIIEAVRQLRGNLGQRQIKNAHTALVHGNGGTLASQATSILGLADTL